MSDLYRIVADLVTAEDQAALRLEVRELRKTAELGERLDYQLVEGIQLLSPARKGFVRAGPVRSAFHTGAVAERVSALLGRRVEPVLSSYLLYERGDFVGLHVDQRRCQLTVLVLLEGDAGPLYVHPELQDLPAGELRLRSRAHAGHPPGGTAVYLQDGPLLLHGGQLPHHRPRHDGSKDVTLAALCYSLLPNSQS